NFYVIFFFFFFSSRRRHTRCLSDWSSDVCSSDLLTLTAFGLDSLIELASACMLIWRLNVELRHGQAFSQDVERTASKIGGGLLRSEERRVGKGGRSRWAGCH